MIGDAEVDARCTEVRRRLGDGLEQRDALIVPASLKEGQRLVIIEANIATDFSSSVIVKPTVS